MKPENSKTRCTDKKEDWTGGASACTSDKYAAWLCSINGRLHKNQITNGKLAWNVIGKEGFTDESRLDKHRQCKHMCIICAIVSILLIILSLSGVFDRDEILYYKYRAYNNDAVPITGNTTNQNIMDVYNLDKEIIEADGPGFPEIDEEMLDYTMYAVAAEYCVKNNLALDGYRITKSYKIKEDKGEFLLLCDMFLRHWDIKRNQYGSSGFNVIVYPGTHKSSKRQLAGTYTHHVNDKLTSRKGSPVYRDIVIRLQPSEEGYFVIVEDRRGLKNPGCGNLFIEAFDGYEPSVATNFYINNEIKENRVYLFDRTVTGSNLIFEMEFRNGKLIMRYCREGEDINNKDYMEMEA